MRLGFLHLALKLARRFVTERRAGPATEFALVGMWAVGLIFVVLNLALLSFSLSGLARGVQQAARVAVATAAANEAGLNSYPAGTFVCPSATQIAGFFSQYANPPLSAAGTTSASNPYITASWTNNSTTTGVYLQLVGTYNWKPLGFNYLSGIQLRISTVAFVPGTTPISGTPSYTPTIDSGGSCSS